MILFKNSIIILFENSIIILFEDSMMKLFDICIMIIHQKYHPIESFEERPLKNHFYNDHSTKITHTAQSLNFTNKSQSPNSAVFLCL